METWTGLDEDLQNYQDWVEKFYSAVGKMPQTTFGDWQVRRIALTDILDLLSESQAESEEMAAIFKR